MAVSFKNLVSVAVDPSAQPRRANVAFTGPFAAGGTPTISRYCERWRSRSYPWGQTRSSRADAHGIPSRAVRRRASERLAGGIPAEDEQGPGGWGEAPRGRRWSCRA